MSYNLSSKFVFNNVLAVIPARGGSKGIPDKNIKMLVGKPLIAHTIDAAIHSNHINRVVVSTDSQEIQKISKAYGAEIIKRPSEISGDTASSESALLHALDYLEENEGYKPDLIVFLQCTSPLTLPEDIDSTIQVLMNEGADTALSVAPFHYFLWKRKEDGSVIGINHNKDVRQLRQEREDQYLENGAIYVMNAKGFKINKHRFFGKTAQYIMPKERSLEIDEPVDLRIAEVLIQDSHTFILE